MGHDVRLQLKGKYGLPSAPAWSREATADDVWRLNRNESRTNGLFFLQLDDIADGDDKRANSETNARKRAIMLASTPRYDDKFNRLHQWTQIVSDDEKEIRKLLLEQYRQERDDLLEEKANQEDGQLSDKDEERLVDVKQIIDELAFSNSQVARTPTRTGPGFQEQVPDAFGDGTISLYHSLSTPNVPSHKISNFKIGQDTAFCSRFYWARPKEEQEDAFLSFRFDHWKLTFFQTGARSGGSAKLHRYNDFYRDENGKKVIVTKKLRVEMESQLKAVEDLGRLTLGDKKFISDKKDAIRAVKRDEKAAGRSQNEYSDDAKARIKGYEDEIQARRDSKRGLTPAQKEQADTIRKKLFADVVDVTWKQNSETFFNTPIALTFHPLRRGYLVITMEGAQPFVYQDKLITKQRKFGTIWKDTPIEIETNGGAYWWQVGTPLFENKGVLRLGEYSPFRSIASDGVTITGQFEGVEKIAWENKTISTGNLTNGISPVYEVVAHLTGGETTPIIYSAHAYVAPGERTGSEEVVWDSGNHLDRHGVNPIIDAKVSHQREGRRMSFDLILRNVKRRDGTTELTGNGEVFPMFDLEGRLCDVWIDGEIVLKNGIIRKATPSDMATVGTDEDAPEGRAETTIPVVIGDMWSLIGEMMIERDNRPVGDAMYLGQWVKQCLRATGARESELVFLNETYGRIMPEAGAGEKAAVIPAEGTSWGDYLRDVFRQYGMDADLWWDGQQGAWLIGIPDKTPKAAFVHQVSANAAPGAARYLVKTPLDMPFDYSNTYNAWIVEGDIDPETGERIALTWIDWELVDRMGRIKWHKAVRDEAIKTKADALWVLRSLWLSTGRAGDFVQVESFFHKLRSRDTITINGKIYEIEDGSGSTKDAGKFQFAALPG